MCVYEAIDEIALVNPEYAQVTINPQSFIYFMRSLGRNAVLFCNWKNKETKTMHYFTGAIDIDLQVDISVKAETAYFTNSKTSDVIEVGLSG